MPLVEAIENNLGRKPEQALEADSGYCSEPNLKALVARGIDGYVAPGRAQHPETAANGKVRGGPLTQLMRTKIDDGGFETPYRTRKQVVEPVFGQIKQARGFRQFLLRGVKKVRAEWAMICCTHNLQKTFHPRKGRAEVATAQQMPGRDAYLDGLLIVVSHTFSARCLASGDHAPGFIGERPVHCQLSTDRNTPRIGAGA